MSTGNTAKGWTLPAALAAATAGGAAAFGFSGDRTITHEIPAGVTVVETYQDHQRYDWRQEGATRFRELATTHGPASLELPRWVGVDEVTYGQEELRFEQLAATTHDGQEITADLRLTLQADASIAGQLDAQHPRWARDIATLTTQAWADTVAAQDSAELDKTALTNTVQATITARMAAQIPGLEITGATTSNLRQDGKPINEPVISADAVSQWRDLRATAMAPQPSVRPAPAMGGAR